MQELITHYPEMYSHVVEYASDQLPKLLLLCKDSYQVIMHRKLYNLYTRIIRYVSYSVIMKFRINLHNQLHGTSNLYFSFGVITVIHNEGFLVKIKLNFKTIQFSKLQKYIFKNVSCYRNVENTTNCVRYLDVVIYFHENGIIKYYNKKDEHIEFRENFSKV